MPRCGIHVTHCDLPIRIDSYKGCDFSCAYCNEHIKGRSRGTPSIGEGRRALLNFIQGKRINTTRWCDWDIPIHWGVLSDPFQPCESQYQQSYKLLRVFAESGYPVVISTKSTMLLEPKYISILSHCNAVLQVSMTSQSYDSQESCPSFRERFCSLYKLSTVVKRLLVRTQPFKLEDHTSVLKMMRAYAASGVHGIMIEGMKVAKNTPEFPSRHGTSAVYDAADLALYFESIRSVAHREGLKFYSAENRLRSMGDSPNCCGTDGLEGFIPNRTNLNYNEMEYTDRMKEENTGGVFVRSWLTKEESQFLTFQSYSTLMNSLLDGGDT